MTRARRRLVLAATVTALGVGGVLLPGASAMAATTQGQSAAVTAPVSRSTAGTAATSAQQTTDYYCEWDGYGNWACIWS